MSTDVIEKPEAVQESSPKVPNRSAINDVLGSGSRRPAESSQQQTPKTSGLLHRIFEGHREFLGWTPD